MKATEYIKLIQEIVNNEDDIEVMRANRDNGIVIEPKKPELAAAGLRSPDSKVVQIFRPNIDQEACNVKTVILI